MRVTAQLFALVGIPLAWALFTPSAQAAEVLSNGSFETGDSTDWNVTGQTNANGNGFGNWYFTMNSNGPLSGRGGEAPSDGSWQAYLDDNGSGSYVLYRDVTLPDYGSITLHFTWWVKNEWGDFANPDTLDRTQRPNQQFRVDIMDPAVPPDWTQFGVLQNILATQPGDPRFTTATTVDADISAFAGQTIRLRFAGANTEHFLRVGVDSVHIVTHPFVKVATGFPLLGGPTVDWGDYDGDDDFDVLITGMNTTLGVAQTRIFRNDAGSFVEQVHSIPGVAGGTGEWIDYDGDGDLDVMVSGLTPPSGQTTDLYANDNGVFSFDDNLIDLFSTATAWGDYDNDGDLDFVITGDDGFNDYVRLYEKRGSHTVDITNLPAMSLGSCQWADYDEDQDLDLLYSGSGSTDVWRNDNLGGILTPLAAGLPGLINSACDWGDYDEDGDLDIAICGELGGFSYSAIFRNDAGTFTDIGAPLAGVRGGSIEWGDYDNDGDLDLLLTGTTGFVVTPTPPETKLYENTLAGFVEVPTDLPNVEYGEARWGDYDADGDLDILIAGLDDSFPTPFRVLTIYENTIGTSNTPPSPPSSPVLDLYGTTAYFDWGTGSDAETAPNGLTYNLWVGSVPMTSDAMPGHSNTSTGYRHIANIGNVGTTSEWTLELPLMSYLYWGVQTVDAGYAGSSFYTGPVFYFAPLIYSVNDMPNDQGGWVRIVMQKSNLDWIYESYLPITTYNVWREIDFSAPDVLPEEVRPLSGQARTALATERTDLDLESVSGLELYEYDDRIVTLGTEVVGGPNLPSGLWELVGSFAAAQQSYYYYAAPTAADSGQGAPAVFVVSSHTATPSIWFASLPDTGYSLDNIAPGAPQSLAVDNISPAGDVDLSWDPSGAQDFQYFALYRGSDPSFVPDELNRVAQLIETDYQDVGALSGGGSYVYKLTAFDHAGNESDAAAVTAGNPVAVDGTDLPKQFAFSGSVPNPIVGRGVVRFDLPVASPVTLTLYDARGRAVVQPFAGRPLPAGSHEWVWDRRDQSGVRVPAGIYFYRFEAGGFRRTTKAVVLD
jgi:hypothetical protein